MKIILNEGGTLEREIDVNKFKIPESTDTSAEMVLDGIRAIITLAHHILKNNPKPNPLFGRIHVPDMWHIAMGFKDAGKEDEYELIIRMWHLAGDLVKALRNL